MEATSGGGASETNSMLLSAGPMSHPIVRRTVFWLLSIRTVADVLPGFLEAIVTSGKMSVIGFAAVYLFLIAMWLPFWLTSFVVGEWGVYTLAVLVVFVIGRAIIRLIAFPGSSHRVSSEIEHEFAKYSVRMILSSCGSISDLTAAILSIPTTTSSPPATDGSDSSTGNSTSTTSYAFYEIPGLWKRAKSYRDRVLGVYFEVLINVLNDGQQDTDPSGRPSSDPATINKYGNNRLSGDVGNLSGLTLEAKADGRTLLELLRKVLTDLERLEEQAKPILESAGIVQGGATQQQISNQTRATAASLTIVVSELKDFATSLKPPSANSGDGSSAGGDSTEENLTVDAVRRRFEEQSGSSFDAVKSGAASILPMIDPPLHTSIFGFDLQRGCMLSRYLGARQLWVPRPGGGMIDVIHIPAIHPKSSTSTPTNKQAVLYCNPNAGLIEVATGMSLAGGNVASEADNVINDNCWTDFYTNLGYDMYLFNYAGFGRSYGISLCGRAKQGGDEPYMPGVVGRIRRICHSTFCGFRPTPDTLRADGIAVATHIVTQLGVESLVIHGESIGGVASSGAARKLTESHLKSKAALLVCDRTFCNLEAVAQRLVGSWSGYAIRCLAPFWSTDVAGDFLAASCPKVVANDCADAIIADSSSLKSGIAFWKEIRRGAASTHGIGWVLDAPLEYRMADWENVCVNDSRYVQSGFVRTTSPVWPADKHITIEEGFHFAACAKRIGKVASIEKKKHYHSSMGSTSSQAIDVEEGVEMNAMAEGGCNLPIFLLWKVLGCCDGLCGSALGVAVKGGFDCTVAWLCSTLVFGGQTIIESMEHRLKSGEAFESLSQLGQVTLADFDCRPAGYEQQETETVVHPKPIPEVIESVKEILAANPDDEILKSVNHEIMFVLGTLNYVVQRLSSAPVIEYGWKNRHLHSDAPMMVGSFMNLNCGHNNPFSASERKRLKTLLAQAMHGSQTTTIPPTSSGGSNSN